MFSISPRLVRGILVANLVVLVAVAAFAADWWIRTRVVQAINQYHALIESRLGRPAPTSPAPGAPTTRP